MRDIRSFDEFVNEDTDPEKVDEAAEGRSQTQWAVASLSRALTGLHEASKECKRLGRSEAKDISAVAATVNDIIAALRADSGKVNEAQQSYFNSYTEALDAAREKATSQGYTIPEDEWWKVSSGPRKPDRGKTNTFTLSLEKDGRPSKRTLSIQVYGMGSRYELNCYVA